MDEQTQVILLPVMENGVIAKLTLKSIGVNAKLKSKNGERTGWVTLEVPSDRVLFVTFAKETAEENTITMDQIGEIFKELTNTTENGLTEQETW